MCISLFFCVVFFFKQKTAYEMRISDWSSDVCSSDLERDLVDVGRQPRHRTGGDRMRRDAAAVEQHQGVARTDATQVDRSGVAAGVVGAGRGLAVVEPG